MPPRSERARNLVKYMQTVLDASRTDHSISIPSYRELSSQFGYAKTTDAAHILKRAGLQEEIRKAKSETNIVVPSRDWAYMLGFLSGGGRIDLRSGLIALSSSDEALLTIFQATGERLFGKNIISDEIIDRKTQRKYKRARFMNTTVARSIGNLGRSEWPETIVQKHPWLFQDEKYVWLFLAGLFETKGYFVKKDNSIGFAFSDQKVTNFTIDLLVRAGLRRPSTIPVYARGQGGVQIKNVRDIQTFAKIVHSRLPAKEERLKFYRENSFRYARSPDTTNEGAFQEYVRIRTLLGHPPKSSEIDRLRKQGVTPYVHKIYSIRFGKGSNKFIIARDNLERIIREREEAGRGIFESQGGRVFP